LAIARLILVPVIFLAVYYLFEMGWIVDRIVNLDAPAAKLAQGASIEILEARRAERNYLLLHDPIYRAANRESLARSREILSQIQDLEPQDSAEAQSAYTNKGSVRRNPRWRNRGREMPTASRPWCALMKKI
jgi:hypothetical protein